MGVILTTQPSPSMIAAFQKYHVNHTFWMMIFTRKLHQKWWWVSHKPTLKGWWLDLPGRWVISDHDDWIHPENSAPFKDPLDSKGKACLLTIFWGAICQFWGELVSRERSHIPHIPPWQKWKSATQKCRLGWNLLVPSWLVLNPHLVAHLLVI